MRGLWVAIVIVAAGIVYLKVSASQSSVRMETLQKVVGKRAIVCGGTKGIGKGFALELAKLGFKLSIVGRTGGEEVVEELNKLNGLKNDFFAADLSLVKEARRAARELLDRDNRLDVLVLSQGIGSFEGRTETSEHLDVKMSLHYYSRVAIANECASALETAQGSAVFILSPGAHSVYIPQDGDYELKYSYSVKRVAEACCWYTDLAIESLSLLHPHTRFVHAAPGFVASNWGTDMIFPIRWLIRAVQAVAGTPIDVCAQKLLPTVLAAERGFFLSDSSGHLLAPYKEQTSEVRDAVWKHTSEVLTRLQ